MAEITTLLALLGCWAAVTKQEPRLILAGHASLPFLANTFREALWYNRRDGLQSCGDLGPNPSSATAGCVISSKLLNLSDLQTPLPKKIEIKKKPYFTGFFIPRENVF